MPPSWREVIVSAVGEGDRAEQFGVLDQPDCTEANGTPPCGAGRSEEHFASNVIGSKLRALARGWGEGAGRLALLACPPGEQHELGLVRFGLLLREQGWTIAYLGAETPASELGTAAAELSPALVVIAATDAQ